MTFKEYSQQVLPFSLYPAGEHGDIAIACGLASEAGEVVDLYNKMIRGDKKFLDPSFLSENMKKELGDVLWFVNTLANRFGYTLEEVAEANAEKLTGRFFAGTISGDGDNR